MDPNWIVATAAVLALAGAFVQTSQVRQSRVRDFETSYVHRYWALRDQLGEFALPPELRSTTAPTPAQVAAMYSYIELCEDELDLRYEGWISDKTWALWRSGIVAAVSAEPYRTLWLDVQAAEPGRFMRLRALDSSSTLGTDLGALRRYRNGLRWLFEARPRSDSST